MYKLILTIGESAFLADYFNQVVILACLRHLLSRILNIFLRGQNIKACLSGADAARPLSC